MIATAAIVFQLNHSKNSEDDHILHGIIQNGDSLKSDEPRDSRQRQSGLSRNSGDKVHEGIFSKRLQIASGNEESIVTSLIDEMPSILGMRAEDIAPPHKELLASLARKQHEIAVDIGRLQEDLKNYLSRTQNSRYEEVLLAIQQSEFDTELEQIQEHIANNRPYPATESASQWAKRLRHWAEQLKEENPDK